MNRRFLRIIAFMTLAWGAANFLFGIFNASVDGENRIGFPFVFLIESPWEEHYSWDLLNLILDLTLVFVLSFLLNQLAKKRAKGGSAIN